ncbi:MAG: RidA family protein, partial [Planctomycetota bacterium]
MSVRLLNPDSLAPPRGYAHAAVGGGRPVVLAGQIGCGADGRLVGAGDVVKQFARALDNLLEALRAAGGSPTDIAQMRVFVTDVSAYRARL